MGKCSGYHHATLHLKAESKGTTFECILAEAAELKVTVATASCIGRLDSHISRWEDGRRHNWTVRDERAASGRRRVPLLDASSRWNPTRLAARRLIKGAWLV